jgi:acid phosphatase (class A)
MKIIVGFLAVFVLALSPVHAGYLSSGDPDAVALLAAPPLPDSPEQAADLAEVRSVTRATSSGEKAAALSESKFSVFNFTPVVGLFFQPGKLPVTEEFFHRVHKDAEGAVSDAKNYWKRPRPYSVDPTLAGGKLEKSFSYPSGHSTESMVLALVLAEMFPDKHDALLAHARTMGWHRVEIARHYPTDIYAGRVFAQAIVREMKKSPEFQKDLAAAKAEIIAAQRAARN